MSDRNDDREIQDQASPNSQEKIPTGSSSGHSLKSLLPRRRVSQSAEGEDKSSLSGRYHSTTPPRIQRMSHEASFHHRSNSDPKRMQLAPLQPHQPQRISNQQSHPQESMTTGRGYISVTIDSRGRTLSSTTISRPPERHIRMAPAISPAGMTSQSSSLDSTHSSQYSSRKRESDLSDQSTPKKSKSSSHRKPREKAMHKYEVDQEVFLAEHLATPRINELLNGTNDRNRFPIPKAKVHEEIAFEFNEKFGTSLDGGQIKNKVASMQKQWRAGRKLIANSNALDRPDPTLRSRILKECHFYYIVEPVWSVTLSSTPRKPLENTNHHPEEAPSDIEYESNEDFGGQDENGQDENGQDNNFEEQNYELEESRREQWIQEPGPLPQEHQQQQDKKLLAELRSLIESLKPSLLNPIYADRSAGDENAMAHARKMRELEGEAMCTRELIKLEQLRLEIEKVKLEQLKIRTVQDST